MSDLHRRRSFGFCLTLLLSCVVCLHTTVAAALNSSSDATEVAPSATVAAMSPELQGDLLMVHRSYAAAIDAYQRETSRSAVLSNKIGVAYHHMFALDQARKYYQMALHLNPTYADALNNLAAVYHGQHEYGQAEKIYKQALKLTPDSAILNCNLGTAYFAQENYKQGMKAYAKALALNPRIFEPGQVQIVQETASRRQLVAVNFYLAKTYATAGNMQASLDYLKKAMEAGFHDQKLLMKDKEFAALRSTPEFHQLMVRQMGGE